MSVTVGADWLSERGRRWAAARGRVSPEDIPLSVEEFDGVGEGVALLVVLVEFGIVQRARGNWNDSGLGPDAPAVPAIWMRESSSICCFCMASSCSWEGMSPWVVSHEPVGRPSNGSWGGGREGEGEREGEGGREP